MGSLSLLLHIPTVTGLKFTWMDTYMLYLVARLSMSIDCDLQVPKRYSGHFEVLLPSIASQPAPTGPSPANDNSGPPLLKKAEKDDLFPLKPKPNVANKVSRRMLKKSRSYH